MKSPFPQTSQHQGNSEESRPHSRQQSAKVLMQLEEKGNQLTDTGKKTHICLQCEKSWSDWSNLRTFGKKITIDHQFNRLIESINIRINSKGLKTAGGNFFL